MTLTLIPTLNPSLALTLTHCVVEHQPEMLNEGMISMLLVILGEKDEKLLSKALELFKFFDRTLTSSSNLYRPHPFPYPFP